MEALCIKIAINKEFIKIISLYRPPNTNITEFFDYFEHILSTSHDPTYIIGDYNIDFNSYSSVKLNFENLFYSYNFIPLITLPTRVTPNSSTIIDNILTNVYKKHNNGVLLSDFSDHYPIFSITQNYLTSNSNSNKILKRKLSKNIISKIKMI